MAEAPKKRVVMVRRSRVDADDRTFDDARVEQIIVGGYAVGFYGVPRYTKDLDLWVRPDPENATRVYRALADFGAPLGELAPEDLCDPDHILQVGVEPVRVDVLAGVPGVAADDAFPRSVVASFGGVPADLLGDAGLHRFVG